MPLSFEDNGPGLLTSPHVLRYITNLIFNRPLMIEQTELNFIMCMLAPRIGIAPPLMDSRLRTTTVERKIPGTDKTATTAIIPVHGALVNRRFGLDAESGGPTTYAEIREAHRAAMEDQRVERLLYHFDTGGGEVAGAFDTAQMIYQSRGRKPIDAFLDEVAFSAGYLLASAADRIYMPKTGGAGSIGVRVVFRNQKMRDQLEGYEYEVMTFGEAKDDFNPHKPLGDRARESLRAQLNEIGNMFVDVSARNRRLDRDRVLGMEARTFHGQGAIDMGLVDDFMSFDEAITLDSQQREDFSMADESKILQMLEQMGGQMTALGERLAALEAGPTATQTQGGVVPPEVGSTDHRYEVLNACLAVSGMLGGTEKARALANELNDSKVSLAEAHNRIIARVAESQSNDEIRSTVGAEGYGDINPLDAACDKLVASLPKRQAA